ncbi:MAG: hypothetical protein WA873_07045 [Jannaschia helgolandensis]
MFRALRGYVVGDRMIYPGAVNVLTGLKRHPLASQGDGTLPSQVSVIATARAPCASA